MEFNFYDLIIIEFEGKLQILDIETTSFKALFSLTVHGLTDMVGYDKI